MHIDKPDLFKQTLSNGINLFTGAGFDILVLVGKPTSNISRCFYFVTSLLAKAFPFPPA